ncbi:MAG: T9SS type A sorting domain-containing protein [Ferruginibacter sp.]
MKKILLNVFLLCIASVACAQPCVPEFEGLKPIQLQFTVSPISTIFPLTPLYWNRYYKLDESTGILNALTCAYTGDPNIQSLGYCVCYLSGTYFRRVTDVCDPTPCGGDLPFPAMPKTNNNSPSSNWSQSATWVANQVPNVTSSAAVLLTKSTQVDIDLNFTNDHWLVLSGGNSTILPGKTVNCNSVIQVYPAAQLQNSGTLNGSGKIQGSLLNSGNLSPGNSPGNFTIIGNYTADNTAVHQIEIASANSYDTISIDTDVSTSASGSAVLNGTLNISLLNGFIPSLGDAFRIFSFTSSTGFFSNTNLPALPQGLSWSIHYNPGDVTVDVTATVLPLNFTSISAYPKSNAVQVEWTTENEINVKKFELERSADGTQFSKISTVNAIAGNATGYRWFDATPLKGNNYYRVKAIDGDGKFSYSLVRLIKFIGSEVIILYPNPVKKGTTLQVVLQNTIADKIEIINAAGTLLYSNSSRLTGTVSIRIAPAWAAGQYAIRVWSKNKVETKKIEIQ